MVTLIKVRFTARVGARLAVIMRVGARLGVRTKIVKEGGQLLVA